MIGIGDTMAYDAHVQAFYLEMIRRGMRAAGARLPWEGWE